MPSWFCQSRDQVSVVFVFSTGRFYHSLTASQLDGPKVARRPRLRCTTKGGSNAAHGFDEGLVTRTERIRAGQLGFEPRWESERNVKLERGKKAVRKGPLAVPRVHTFRHISLTCTDRFYAVLDYNRCFILD